MICSICKRSGDKEYFEKHHLIPKNKKSDTIIVCVQCGDQLHLLFNNNELKYDLNTLDKILLNDKIIKYVKWVELKPIEKKFSVAKKKRK